MGSLKGRLYALRSILIRLAAATAVTFVITRGLIQLHIDGWLHLSPCDAAKTYFYIWKEWGLGYAHPDYHVLPLNAFGCLIYAAATPLGHATAVLLYQHIIYILTYFAATYSYDLFYEIANRRRTPALVASLAYFLNPVAITMVHYRYTGWTALWALTPPILLLMLRFIKAPNWRLAVLTALAANTPITAGLYSVGLYPQLLLETLVLYVFTRQAKPANYILFLSVLTLAGSAYLAPQLLGVTQMAEAYESPAEHRQQLQHASQFLNLVNIAQLNAYYGIYGAAPESDYMPYLWRSNPALWISYRLSTLAALSLFVYVVYKLGQRRHTAPLALILALLFVMKGLTPPGEELFEALYALSPTFFRHPYDRLALAWALLYITAAVKIGGRPATLALAAMALPNLTLLPYAVHTYNTLPSSMLEEIAAPPLPEDCARGRILIVPFVIGGETTYNYSGWLLHPNENYPLRFAPLPHLKAASTPRDMAFAETLTDLLATRNHRDLAQLLRLYGFTCIIYEKAASPHLLLIDVNKYLVSASPQLIDDLVKMKYITPTGNYKFYNVYVINNATGLIYAASTCRINATRKAATYQYAIYTLNATCRNAAPGLYTFTRNCTLTTPPLHIPPKSKALATVHAWTFNAAYETHVEALDSGRWRTVLTCRDVCNFTTTWTTAIRIKLHATSKGEVVSVIRVNVTITAERNVTRLETDCRPRRIEWAKKAPTHYLLNGTDAVFATAYDEGWTAKPHAQHAALGGLNLFAEAKELVYTPQAAAETALYAHYAALLAAAVAAKLIKRAPKRRP